MKTPSLTPPSTAGFTVVEALVTLILATVFLTLFFQMYMVMEWKRVTVARQTTASDVAYSNLRKFIVRPSITCDAATMDLTAADGTTKPGLLIGDQTNYPDPSAYGFVAEAPASIQSLGTPVLQSVRAFAPKGCASPTFADTPIKLEATVTYGNPAKKVTHVIFLD